MVVWSTPVAALVARRLWSRPKPAQAPDMAEQYWAVIGAKYAQHLHHGSPQWQAMYSTALNTIEGFDGYVKDANHEALDQPGRRRVRGFLTDPPQKSAVGRITPRGRGGT